MEPTDGGPAFPVDPCSCPILGMSLRDYFAAATLQGICAHEFDAKVMVQRAYALSDAMLEERQK